MYLYLSSIRPAGCSHRLSQKTTQQLISDTQILKEQSTEHLSREKHVNVHLLVSSLNVKGRKPSMV
jgi:hypothetical protein